LKRIYNNTEKLELSNSFQKVIFGQRSAVPLKMPPWARETQPPLLPHCYRPRST